MKKLLAIIALASLTQLAFAEKGPTATPYTSTKHPAAKTAAAQPAKAKAMGHHWEGGYATDIPVFNYSYKAVGVSVCDNFGSCLIEDLNPGEGDHFLSDWYDGMSHIILMDYSIGRPFFDGLVYNHEALCINQDPYGNLFATFC